MKLPSCFAFFLLSFLYYKLTGSLLAKASFSLNFIARRARRVTVHCHGQSQREDYSCLFTSIATRRCPSMSLACGTLFTLQHGSLDALTLTFAQLIYCSLSFPPSDSYRIPA
ncbi:hypothetical protein JB92DRAFT_1954451 [Gautieria morchelliformis]|nr:hypothetical protein JB92DRAFT_1954451 [Gautieria morchelliformis]